MMKRAFSAFLYLFCALLIVSPTTPWARSKCCEIPDRGPPGPQGPTGPQGPAGPPGFASSFASLSLGSDQAVASMAAILFDAPNEIQDITYNALTGELTLPNVGVYMALSSVAPPGTGFDFAALRLNGSTIIPGSQFSSPNGDFDGCNVVIFRTTLPNSTLELINNDAVPTSVQVPFPGTISAYLVVTQIQ